MIHYMTVTVLWVQKWPNFDVQGRMSAFWFTYRVLKWSMPIYWSSLDFSIASLNESFAFSNFSNFGAFGNFTELVKPRRVHNLTKLKKEYSLNLLDSRMSHTWRHHRNFLSDQIVNLPSRYKGEQHRKRRDIIFAISATFPLL